MLLRAYNRKYIIFLEELLIKRGMNPELVSTLPKIGAVVFEPGVDKEVPVAAGFLRMVEGNIGMLDSYISNPDMDKLKKRKAFKFIIDALMARAERMGITQVIAFTKYNHMIEDLVKNHGMSEMPYKFVKKGGE